MFSLPNTYGKRQIQGTKAILFELKGITLPTDHTDQQGRYLSERWELYGACAGKSASTIPNWLTWIPRKTRPESTRRINIVCPRLFRVLGPRVFSMNVRWRLQCPFMVSSGGSMNLVHSDVPQIPQFICNHRCRDGVCCNGDRTAWIVYGIICMRPIIIETMRGRYPWKLAEGQPLKCIDSVKGNSFLENI